MNGCVPDGMPFTRTTTESSFSVPGLTLSDTLIWPATVAGGTGTGVFRFAPVIEAIWTVAGTGIAAEPTTTVAQFVTLATPVAEATAQIATPGEAATPVTTPAAVTVAEAELLVVHATVGVTPASALTAAVRVIDWPTVIEAVDGATCTLLILPAGVVGW